MFKATIQATKAALLNRELKATEMVEAILKEIEHKKYLNIFLSINKENALESAKTIDKDIEHNIERVNKLPLLGIPIAHKDLFLTKGLRTTAASKVLANYIPPYSATVVDKLAAAGAIVMGKVNCDAWAHGSSGENSDFGATLNPLNQDLVPGGSSSGSAAAVAAGLVQAATATDTGGSIRLPANFTGTVGFKPTYGRVSRYGVIAMASSLDSIGHITANVGDAAQLLAVTSGVDVHDATTADSRPFTVPDFANLTKLKGIKIGVPREYLEPIKNPEIKANFNQVVKELTRLGAEIVDISLPHSESALAVYYVIQPAEVSSNLARFDGVRFGQARDQFGAEAMRRIMIGTFTLSAGYYDAYYKAAQKVRTLVIDDFTQAFSQTDLLLAPVSPTGPFKLGEKIADPLAMYLSDILTIPVNLAGLPAIALPSGKTKAGLPLGIQLIAKRYQEEALFGAAYLLEQSL